MNYKRLIDGGYFSYIFGTRQEADFGGWSTAKWAYTDDLILLEGGTLWRNRIFPAYKARRRERKQQDIASLKKRKRVVDFRRFLDEDVVLTTAKLPGFEADDILSVMYLHHPVPTMAVDKDLFQVPGLAEHMIDFNGKPSLRKLKQPQYTYRSDLPPERVFHQAIFGDRSDGIPRLLSSTGSIAKLQYRELLKESYHTVGWTSVELFNAAEQTFGEAFFLNLLLLLMPAPVLSSEYFLYEHNHGALYRAIVYSDYWSPHYYSKTLEILLSSIKENTHGYDS